MNKPTSKQNYDTYGSVDKRTLWVHVNEKINGKVNHRHVLSIMTILFEELLVDLKAGKSFKIINFGTLYLKQFNPKKYWNVILNKMCDSKGNRNIKFVLVPKLKRFLIDNLDIENTFSKEEDDNKSEKDIL